MPVPATQRNPAVRLVQGSGKVLREENSRTALTIMVTPSKEARAWPQFLAGFTATLGALTAGTFFAWSSSVESFLVKKVGNETFSWLASGMLLGAFAGCLFAGMAANRFGRHRTLLLQAPPLLLAWILVSITSSVTCMMLGRLLAGLSIGVVSVVAGMYVSEIASPSVRGTLGSFYQLQVTVGILAGYVAGLLHSPEHLAYVNMALPVLYAVLFWSMPESPVFLLASGHSERARESLQWLRGPEYDVTDEITAIRHSIMESQQTKASIKDLFKSRSAAKGMVVALGLMGAQQLSGVNAVIFYTGRIFKMAGSSISGDHSAIIVGVVQVLSTFLSTVLADRAGRRVLLLLSSSVMTICLAMLAVYFHLDLAKHDMTAVSWLPLVTMSVFIVMFSLGLGPLPWCVVGEVFSPTTKGAASSIACAANWLMAFCVAKFFSNLLELVNISGAFFIFAGIAALGTVFIAIVVPETKGKTLEEILAELSGIKGYPVEAAAAAIAEEDDEEEAVRGRPFAL